MGYQLLAPLPAACEWGCLDGTFVLPTNGKLELCCLVHRRTPKKPLASRAAEADIDSSIVMRRVDEDPSIESCKKLNDPGADTSAQVPSGGQGD